MGKSEQDIQNNIFIAPLSSIYPLLLLFGTVKHYPNLSSELKKKEISLFFVRFF